jgi:hypothetical protein
VRGSASNLHLHGSLMFVGVLAACGLDASGELAPGGGAQPPLADAQAPVGDASATVSPTEDAADDSAPDSAPGVGVPPPSDAAAKPNIGTDAGAPFCDPSDPSLLLCLRFENEVRDESSHGLMPTSAVVGYTAGVRGQAAAFTPPTDDVVFPNDALWNVANVTVEAWVRPATLPPSMGRAGVLDSDGRFGLFLYAPGTIDCLVQSVHLVGPVLATAQWTHVACTYDGSNVTLYVGGTRRATAPLASAGATAGSTAIGQNSPSGDNFDGAIDELRVFSVARTAAEIAAAATP